MTNEAMNLYLSFDEALARVKSKLDILLTTSPKIIREYTRHLALSQGKYIRAFSILTCAQNNSGLIHSDAVSFAVSIELLHLATLVHDDVIDDAKTRRGVLTLQKIYGKRTAVICGDYILCLALKAASGINRREDYINLSIPDYMSRICLGELNQNNNNGNLNLSVYDYLKIISGKTAALFELSFYAGSVLCEKDESILQQYSRLGHYIGMIFQLTDDCIDFEATESDAQKPVGKDYEDGVITLPLIFAIRERKAGSKPWSTSPAPRSAQVASSNSERTARASSSSRW